MEGHSQKQAGTSWLVAIPFTLPLPAPHINTIPFLSLFFLHIALLLSHTHQHNATVTPSLRVSVISYQPIASVILPNTTIISCICTKLRPVVPLRLSFI